MSKLKIDDYTMTTIEIYLNNDNPHRTREIVHFIAKKYDLAPYASHEEPYECIIERSGETKIPQPPESEMARENRRLREDYYSLASTQSMIRGITAKNWLTLILVVAAIVGAVKIWTTIR